MTALPNPADYDKMPATSLCSMGERVSNDDSEAVRIDLEGEFDISDVERLTALLEPLVDAPTAVIDLSRTRYIDSSALSCLIRIAKRRNGRASRIVLADPQPHIRRVLEIANLDHVFDLVGQT